MLRRRWVTCVPHYAGVVTRLGSSRRASPRAGRGRARPPRRSGRCGPVPASRARTEAAAKRGSLTKARAPSIPSSPSPMLAWRSRFEPSGVCESLRCSEPIRPRADRRSHSSIIAGERGRACGSRTPRRAGGRSRGRGRGACAAAAGLEQRGELLERAPERAAGAGGVLEVQRAALGLRERRARKARRRARSPVPTSAGLRRARMHHDARARRSRRRRAGNGSARRATSRGSRVVGGAVEQVDGVDHHRADLARGERLAKAREVLVAVGGGSPHARGDWLKIWIARAPERGPALDRAVEAARGRDVGARLASVRLRHESSLRSFPDRRPAHRRRPHGVVQLAARAQRRRALRAADRRYRPRALHARERRADPRRAALARARLGRGADLPDRARGAPPRGGRAAARRAAAPTAPRRPPRTCKAWKASTATTAASAASREPTARSACASPTRATRRSMTSSLGEVRSPNRSIDDLVIARADGTPLYNLAVAVDDLDARRSRT